MSNIQFKLHMLFVFPCLGSLEAAPVQEDHISEQTIVLAEEANGEELQYPSENGEIATDEEEVPVAEGVEEEVPLAEVVEEEVPVAEVVDEVPDDWQLVDKSNVKTDEMPKKSYASIVSWFWVECFTLLLK